MIKKVMDQWAKNKDKLREALAKDKELNMCDYDYLVEKVVHVILNESKDHEDLFDDGIIWNINGITTINDGDYQGTLLFIIPRATYQPCESEYLITYVNYGSCSVCDTLQGIQDYSNELPTEKQLDDYTTLCLHLCENMKKPYLSYSFDMYDVEMEYEE